MISLRPPVLCICMYIMHEMCCYWPQNHKQHLNVRYSGYVTQALYIFIYSCISLQVFIPESEAENLSSSILGNNKKKHRFNSPTKITMIRNDKIKCITSWTILIVYPLSRIRETINLSMCADYRNNTKKNLTIIITITLTFTITILL